METIAIDLTGDELDVLVDALRSATEHAKDETNGARLQRLRQKLLGAWLAANMFDLDV